ncbi:MAG: GTP-binding protein [Rhodospirillales bacterium]|nr:GTP-binding protein [Rhodospirillales bacterium]
MIPVLLVTGFLGSGKTTLIRRILADPAFARSAVIVNEWGEIGLDHDLIASADESLLELATGCLCCRVSSDLGRTFSELARRGAGRYERVLIETSGLADPAPILHSLLTDPTIRAGHVLHGTLTLVDARAGEANLARHPEARRQVALADRLLITKTDLAPDIAGLDVALDTLNPDAERMTAVRGAIAPAALFSASPLPASPAGPPVAVHGSGITSGVLIRERPVPALALILLLQALTEHCGRRLLRVKGLVDVVEMPGQPALIHGVQHVFEPPQWLPAWPGEDRRTRLVFIGEGVPRYLPARLLAAIEEEVVEEMAADANVASDGRLC